MAKKYVPRKNKEMTAIIGPLATKKRINDWKLKKVNAEIAKLKKQQEDASLDEVIDRRFKIK